MEAMSGPRLRTLADVSFGSTSANPQCLRYVRSAPNNGLKSDIAASRFRARKRHMAVQQIAAYSNHLVGTRTYSVT